MFKSQLLIVFDANKAEIELEANAIAYREFKLIAGKQYDVPKAELIDELELFLEKYPNHYRAPKFLAGILNSVAWNMVTAAPDTEGYNPEQGLIYAIRAVELADDINYIYTLAEAYFATGQIDRAKEICIDMLEKHPGNRMFVDRLKRCKEIENE